MPVISCWDAVATHIHKILSCVHNTNPVKQDICNWLGQEANIPKSSWHTYKAARFPECGGDVSMYDCMQWISIPMVISMLHQCDWYLLRMPQFWHNHRTLKECHIEAPNTLDTSNVHADVTWLLVTHHTISMSGKNAPWHTHYATHHSKEGPVETPKCTSIHWISAQCHCTGKGQPDAQ